MDLNPFPPNNFLSRLLLLPPSSPAGSSDEVSLEQESEDDMNSSRTSLDKQTHHRANTTMHVCWHRNTSVSMSDHSLAVEVLLRCPHVDMHTHTHTPTRINTTLLFSHGSSCRGASTRHRSGVHHSVSPPPQPLFPCLSLFPLVTVNIL